MKRSLRLLLSVLLLAMIFTAVDMSSLAATLGRLSSRGMTLLVLLYFLSQILSAMKWHVLVQEAGIAASKIEVLQAYFLGMFVNTFGLGTVGGDVARSIVLQPERGRRAAALATVAADRIHGLTVLLAIGILGILAVPAGALDAWVLPLGALSLACLLGCWRFGPLLLMRVAGHHERYGPSVVAIARAFPSSGRPFASATFYSAISHLLQILMHAVMAAELNIPLPAVALFAAIPLVNIAASLPITFQGIGVREGMYLLLLTSYGMTEESAVAFGAVWILAVTAVNAAGGLLCGSQIRAFRKEPAAPPRSADGLIENKKAA